MKVFQSKIQRIVVGTTILFFLIGIGVFAIMERNKNCPAVSLICDWYKFMLNAEVETEGFRFPIVARFYAYAGIAAYAVGTSQKKEDYIGLEELFDDLKSIPKPEKNIQVLPALNACYAEICRSFFIGGKNDLDNKNKRLFDKWNNKFNKTGNYNEIKASIEFGTMVAQIIYNWAASDKIAHRAELAVYDTNYKFDTLPGSWRASVRFPLPPMLPNWGKARRFIANSPDLLSPPPTPYSIDQNSKFYKEALEIYAIHNPLTQDNRWIAEFWDDDHPGQVISHPGHWVSIALQVFQKERPPLELMIECMFKLGISLNDAAVNCWKSKYTYKLERPEHYIQQYIDPNWEPLGVSPPHPSYPSGHSTFGSAAAEILTFYFGNSYKLKDRSHEGRTVYKVKSRKFNSFREMALENSLSRMFLGVHYKTDCDEGRRLGEQIGKAVANFPVKHSEIPTLAN